MGCKVVNIPFNRTNVESELTHVRYKYSPELPFNRTNVELKRYFTRLLLFLTLPVIEPVWN